MPSSEFLQEWAWLIAVALSFGFVGLLIGLRRLQAHQAQKRAAVGGSESASDIRANFLRARRNFFLLVAVFVVMLIAIELWNLYFYLER